VTVKYIPIPPELLRRSRRPGKFQDSRPTVTIREFAKAVEIFSGGRIRVSSRSESEKTYRSNND